MSDERFERIFRHSPSAIAIMQRSDGMYLDVNEQYQLLTGYSRAELIGRTGTEVMVWGEANAYQVLLQMLAERGVVGGWETVHWQQSGAHRHVIIWAEPIDWDGCDAVLAQFVDVTERKQADVQIHNYMLRAAALADISRALAEVSLDPQALLALAARVVVRLVGDLCVIRLLSPDGIWLDLAAADHVRPSLLEFFRSITIQTRLSALEGVFGEVLQSVQPFFRVGRTPEDFYGVTSPGYHPYVEQIGMSCMLILPLRVQSRIIGVMSIVRDRGGQPYSAADQTFLQDVADRVAIAVGTAQLYNLLEVRVHERTIELEGALEALAQANRNLSLLNNELARAARLKDEFLANVSHELRTPLTAILGRSETLREQFHGPLNERQQRAVRSIEESGQHLLALINDVLDLSRIETGTIELEIAPVHVPNLCQASLRLITPAATRKQIAVSTNLDEHVTLIEADERRLRQVLTNLLSNAVKFTPEGGSIGLDVVGDSINGQVVFTVWDTGIGISAEDQDRLFQPFVQVDGGLTRRYEGTGLGLAMVARLMELHGGRVELESELHQGSRFRVILPWQHTVQTPEHPATWLEALPPLRRALIVEALPTLARQIGDYLGELGAQVLIHPMGSAVGDHVRAMSPDVIIVNVQLPDRSGWDVVQQLKLHASTGRIPMIMITSPGEQRTDVYQPDAVLIRPISRRQFQHALYQAISRVHRAATVRSNTPLVLLAEDNEALRRLLHDFLTRCGYCVITASNGAEALRIIVEEQPACVVLDVVMPRMDGVDILRRMRADTALAAIPVICISEQATSDERRRCLEAGANVYFVKPVLLGDLAQAVKRLLIQVAL